jgi:hypothetical protein
MVDDLDAVEQLLRAQPTGFSEALCRAFGADTLDVPIRDAA